MASILKITAFIPNNHGARFWMTQRAVSKCV
eukprot:CAMPEP_0182880378 /NCGR_PEP_ID=MMETSP0034_2-20130328/16532_1 /TAXON_ID=156128 /ORGANISM="Nephroselmis pyriformis, Strain CCMP717" /LENGTH=30 /DNA_ID= /DNA_START= /DNA_END= /DNA_ORIENTATION=